MSAGRTWPAASKTGRLTTLPMPRMPTSGWLMTGVENRPPMLPTDVTVNVPPRRSSSRALPARASALSRSISRAMLAEVLLVGVADHRHDQAGRRRHGDADVVVVVQDDLVGRLVQAGVDQRHLLERRRPRP